LIDSFCGSVKRKGLKSWVAAAAAGSSGGAAILFIALFGLGTAKATVAVPIWPPFLPDLGKLPSYAFWQLMLKAGWGKGPTVVSQTVNCSYLTASVI
jgi:hypothetical protein